MTTKVDAAPKIPEVPVETKATDTKTTPAQSHLLRKIFTTVAKVLAGIAVLAVALQMNFFLGFNIYALAAKKIVNVLSVAAGFAMLGNLAVLDRWAFNFFFGGSKTPAPAPVAQ